LCWKDSSIQKKKIGAENVKVFTDIKKKHSSHSITADIPIDDTAKAAEYFLSDGVIVTGLATGEAASLEDILVTKKAVKKIPVLVGSGVTLQNVESYLVADALIVGSYFKVDGDWKNAVDLTRTKEFMDKVKYLRS